MRRRAGLLAVDPLRGSRAAPPGLASDAFSRALIEDSYELLADLVGVDVAVLTDTPAHVQPLLWPRTRLVEVPAAPPLELVWRLLDEAAGADAERVAVLVAADTPDLPGLTVAKCFSALARRPVAAVPARLAGSPQGLVALGCRLPAPQWLVDAVPDAAGFDDPGVVQRLRMAAPPHALELVPAWHRLRNPRDIAALDPGLEGWAATREVLGRGATPLG